MNTATKNLENDHVYILRLTDVMEKMINQKSDLLENFEKVVFLIKNYADGLHHAKEENLLFPAMVEKGYSTEQGPIAVMLHDHLTGRNFVKGMEGAIYLMRKGEEDAFRQLYNNMQGYIELLRSHIYKENNILFRMADNVFSPSDQTELLEKFSQIENDNSSEHLTTAYIKDIENLESVYHQ